MRLYRLTRGEVAEIVLASRVLTHDEKGRPIVGSETKDGRAVYVVIALDAPNFVVTVFGDTP